MSRKRKKKRKTKEIMSTEKLISKREIIISIVGVFITLYPIVNSIFNLVYQIKCENFYHIPGKYFNSNVDYTLLYLACAILLVAMVVYPVIMHKIDKKNGVISKRAFLFDVFLSIIMGMVLGIINVYNLLEIMKKTYHSGFIFSIINNWLNNHAIFTVFIIIVMGTLSIVGYVLIDKFKDFKNKYIKKAFDIILIISIIFNIFLFLYGTIYKLIITVEENTAYEMITYDEKNYIALTTYKDKILAVEFERNEDVYILKTYQYVFIDQLSCKYEYLDFKSSPLIQYCE